MRRALAGLMLAVLTAAACRSSSYALNPTSQAASALGGSFTVPVTTQSGCDWEASTDDGWIQFEGKGNDEGKGSGTVSYRVSLGVLFSRTGHITIAGQILTVNQSALLLANDR